jgi:hypothetical protein
MQTAIDSEPAIVQAEKNDLGPTQNDPDTQRSKNEAPLDKQSQAKARFRARLSSLFDRTQTLIRYVYSMWFFLFFFLYIIPMEIAK